MDDDLEIRLQAFNWLNEQVDIHGDVLPRSLLQDGFIFRGCRVPLVSPQGIFKPKIMEQPLTITTTPNSPYDDRYSEDGLLLYMYRGTDPSHPDNAGLREVMTQKKPLIYFHGVVPGKYLPVWPVFIVADDPTGLSFTIAVDDLASLNLSEEPISIIAEEPESRRTYLTALTKIRLHQRGFREKVLEAYRSQCSFCRLRYRELLDAAHIIPDHEPGSRPTVDNGLALCKLHHAAFDSLILGISPDYVIRVRPDILQESDGPILLHGLQEFDGRKLILPSRESDWPDRDALDWKYQRFLEAA